MGMGQVKNNRGIPVTVLTYIYIMELQQLQSLKKKQV